MVIDFGKRLKYYIELSLFLLTLSLFAPQAIKAACYRTTDPALWCGGRAESCNNNAGGASGIAVYNCSNNYEDCYDDNPQGYGCYYHAYSCDTSCSGGSAECPAECRQGSSCGAGYSGASGCSGNGPGGGCKTVQVCCAANSCGGGGGGGPLCPCGENWTSICTTPVTCANDFDGNQGSWCGGSPLNPAYWCEYYAGCNTCPVCATTQPTNVVVTQNSPTSATVTWTPGTGGNGQSVYAGPTQSIVQANCNVPGSDCVLTEGVPSGDTSYTTGNIFQPGIIYYFKVVNSNSTIANCSSGSSVVSSLSSCSLSPSVLSLAPTNTATLTAVVNANTLIQRVDFSSSNSSIVSVSPTSDTTYQYQTIATGVNPGSATVTATVYSTSGTIICQTGSASYPGSQNSTVTVLSTTPWWQVKI